MQYTILHHHPKLCLLHFILSTEELFSIHALKRVLLLVVVYGDVSV